MNNHKVNDLLDEESLAVLGIMLAVSLEFGFGFAKTVAWWAGLARALATDRREHPRTAELRG